MSENLANSGGRKGGDTTGAHDSRRAWRPSCYERAMVRFPGPMNLFGMITVSASRDYAVLALRSFFRHTPAERIGAFVLLDNDGDFEWPADVPTEHVTVLRNASPLGFAANANVLLGRAREHGADLFLLNNDLVFTAGWLDPLLADRPAILGPVSNAELPYRTATFALQPVMALADYVGHEDELDQLANAHRASHSGYQRVAAQPFFCVKIPATVYNGVGDFDERFGRGGAEDRDYTIRAWLAGFPHEIALGSYVLHFQGRSTWRGGETPEDTAARNEGYTTALRAKWGDALAYAFLQNSWNLFLSNAPLAVGIRNRRFGPVIEHLRANPSLEPFFERQRHARFGAVCCIYDDDAWIGPTVESVYEAVAGIWFLVSDRPWRGEPSDQEPLIAKIRALPDPDGKIHVVRGSWPDEATQRNKGLRLLAEAGIDYCMVLDADEVHEPPRLLEAMQHVRQRAHVDVWRMHMFTYWKSCRYRVDPPESFLPVVFVRVGIARFTENRDMRTGRQQVVPEATAMMHHMSYARTNEQVQRKIETFSHASQMVSGWYERVWLGWDTDRAIENLNPCWPGAYRRIVEQPRDALPAALRSCWDAAHPAASN